MVHHTFCDIIAHSRADAPVCKSKPVRIGTGMPGDSPVWMQMQTVVSEISGRVLLNITTENGTQTITHDEAQVFLTILELTLDPYALQVIAGAFMDFSNASQGDA